MQEISDLQFMQEQARWPYWPVLPLKRHDGNNWWTFGFLWGTLEEAVKPIVYDGGIYDNKMPLETRETKVYESLEAIVADGWIVD